MAALVQRDTKLTRFIIPAATANGVRLVTRGPQPRRVRISAWCTTPPPATLPLIVILGEQMPVLADLASAITLPMGILTAFRVPTISETWSEIIVAADQDLFMAYQTPAGVTGEINVIIEYFWESLK